MSGDLEREAGYAQAIRRLAELTGRAEAERAEADAWYERQCAAAERAVRDAEQAVRRAEAEVADAQQEVDRTEAESIHLWSILRGQFGAADRRVGEPPVPRNGVGVPADVEALLDGVRELLDRARKPGELPSATRPLLALFGVLGAAAAYALGLAARTVGDRYGGDLAVGMPVLGLLVTLLGPVVGLAPARVLADRRHAGLDVRSALVVVVAGLVTTGALFGLLR
ncbi:MULTISPECIES: hypothetical protein [unclassified Plantactinospora]|uniref:hypothetical protein n=1 Tax=unclassified Plantactinospora TaxID=2631981 RepID=UPI000D165379|nr:MULTISPECIES: hypothetical protein [unclassified Plantactinospora]AVT28624.1 hypothetical protein C6361_02945 [Plantactinospora sp. BC1]AVT38136.1 hypothetical protein C6W10_18685 [Plantactinospora sp. BB1]